MIEPSQESERLSFENVLLCMEAIETVARKIVKSSFVVAASQVSEFSEVDEAYTELTAQRMPDAEPAAAAIECFACVVVEPWPRKLDSEET